MTEGKANSPKGKSTNTIKGNPNVLAVLNLQRLLAEVLMIPFECSGNDVTREEFRPIMLNITMGNSTAFDLCIAEPTSENAEKIMRIIKKYESCFI